MKIVLVEWAAYPLERDKIVGEHVVRCGLGRVLEAMRRWPAGLPFEVILVINRAERANPKGVSGRAWHSLQRMLHLDAERQIDKRMQTYASLPSRYEFIESVHFRDNRGQDFGAYDFGYRLLQSQGYEGDVLFMNSSVEGPHGPDWLVKYRDQFYRHDKVGLCGISLNSHDTNLSPQPFAPHVQSYFLYTNMKVLRDALGPRMFDVEVTDKLDVIQKGEIGLSQRVLDAGYGITAASFPQFMYRRGGRWSIPYGDLRYAPGCELPVNRM